MSTSTAALVSAARSALALRRRSRRMVRPCQSSLSVDSNEATDPAGDGSGGAAQRVTPLAPLGFARVTSSALANATGSSIDPGAGALLAISLRLGSFAAGLANAAVLVRLLLPPASDSFSFSSPASLPFEPFRTFFGVALIPSVKVKVPNGLFHHASVSSSRLCVETSPSEHADSLSDP